MKRKVLLMMFMVSAVISYAQSDNGINKLLFTLESGISTKQHDMMLTTGSLALGYEVLPGLYPYATYGVSYALSERNSARTYYETSYIGGGLEYRICSFLGLSGKVTTTIGSADWKYTAYEAGVKWPVFGDKANLGLGYHYTSSRTSGISDHSALSVTLGIRIF